ncbi:MAG: 1-acyl-sn-glycerol-3-phosphate acyltransferase [Acidimicrobiales bacterium]
MPRSSRTGPTRGAPAREGGDRPVRGPRGQARQPRALPIDRAGRVRRPPQRPEADRGQPLQRVRRPGGPGRRPGRLPRFIAKATLWKVPGVGLLLGAAGVLPVHRAADGGGDNRGTFDTVVEELRGGETVAIFPEGTTHDEPHMAEVRTGAARLALDAAAAGVPLRIVPIGLTFEDKVALRSRVAVRVGRTIDPAAPPYRGPDGAPVGSDDHEAVRALTEQVRAGIAKVSPDFPDLIAAVEMRRAADVALRTDDMAALGKVSLARSEQLAQRLDRLPPDQREPIATAAAEYALLLDAVGIGDDYLVPRLSARALVGRAIATLAYVLVLLPFALVGVVVNAIPALLVAIAGLAATAPVSKGTNRVLVGLVAFPLTWYLVAAHDVGTSMIGQATAAVTMPLDPAVDQLFGGRSGFGASLVVFLASPICGLLAAWLAERIHRLWRTFRALATNLNRRGQVDALRARRAELVAMVRAAATA